MATQEITVTHRYATDRYVTATLRNTYTTSLTNESLTVSGTLSLIGDGVIDVGDSLYVDLSNATLSVFGSQLVSVSSKTISAYAGGEAGISRHKTVEQTLGTYTKVISRTHSAQSVVVSMAAGALTARDDYNEFTRIESETRTTTISLAARPSYTISYNANGGSSTPASQTKWYNEPLTLRPAITRDNYLFGGWKWNNTGSAVAAGSSWNAANATGTFYAVWDYKYQRPSITRLTAWRTGTTASGGVYPKQDDGTNADIQVVLTAGKEKATAGGAYSVANTTVKFYYKLNTASSYTLLSTQTLSSATGTLTAHISSTLDTDKQYDVKVDAYITASATQSTSFTTFISTSFFLMDMTTNGVAFGRSADANSFKCALPTTLTSTLNVEGTLSTEGALSTEDVIRSANSQTNIILSGVTNADCKAIDTSLTTSSTDTEWLTALLKAICVKYPNKQGCIFKGTLSPNSRLFYEINIYDTSVLSTGLPQYSYGTYTKYYNVVGNFGTTSHTFFIYRSNTPDGIGAVPTSRTVNGKALSSNISLTATDVDALPTRPSSIEFQPPSTSSAHGGYIDFHYNQSTENYTTRIIESSSGNLLVTGGLRINNHSSVIGARLTGTNNSSLALTTGTSKWISSISLPAGTWVVYGQCRFPSTSATGKACRLNISSTQNDDYIHVQQLLSSVITGMEVMVFASPTATTPYYLNAFQNSGSSMTVTTVALYAMRIA